MLEEIILPQEQMPPRRSLVHKIAGVSPYVRKSREIARKSKAYSRPNPKAQYKILFIGDSTVVGVGGKQEESIAARFAKKYPEAHIDNYAVSGARAEDVLEQIKKAKGRYNLALINVGGNDIIALTPLERLRRQVGQILEIAQTKSDKVSLGLCGRMIHSPLVPGPIKGWVDKRQARLSALYQELTHERGALYINYFGDEELNQHFAREPNKYFSEDRFHPSGEGYRIAFERLQKILEEQHL